MSEETGSSMVEDPKTLKESQHQEGPPIEEGPKNEESSQIKEGSNIEEDGQNDEDGQGQPHRSDSNSSFSNPEPPAELMRGNLLNADNIGDTVFSKHWLFTTLMNLIKVIDSHQESKEPQTESEGGVDLDDDLQDELCKLWDMSMNPDVVSVLQEFKAVELFTGVIAASRAPRATEICVGILGNMACDDSACKQIAEINELIKFILMLLKSPDTPTLVETSRLIHTCLSNKQVSKKWIQAIKNDNEVVFSQICFILQSSTNKDLLKNTGELVDKQMDADYSTVALWSNEELVGATLEALKQLGDKQSELQTMLHILQLVSTCEGGCQALVEFGEELHKLTLDYLSWVCEDDMIVLEDKANTIASAVSVINVLLSDWGDNLRFISNSFALMRNVLKILAVLYPEYDGKGAERVQARRRTVSVTSGSPRKDQEQTSDIGSEDESEEEKEEEKNEEEEMSREDEEKHELMIVMLYDVLQNCLIEMVNLFTECPDGSETEDQLVSTEDNKSTNDEGNGDNNDTTHNSDVTNTVNKDENNATNKTDKTANKTESTDKNKSATGISDKYGLLGTDQNGSFDTQNTTKSDDVTHNDSTNNDVTPMEQDADESEQNENTLPRTLEYLDTMCDHNRLGYMVLTLKDGANVLQESGQEQWDILSDFKETAERFKLNRVLRIIEATLVDVKE